MGPIFPLWAALYAIVFAIVVARGGQAVVCEVPHAVMGQGDGCVQDLEGQLSVRPSSGLTNKQRIEEQAHKRKIGQPIKGT